MLGECVGIGGWSVAAFVSTIVANNDQYFEPYFGMKVVLINKITFSLLLGRWKWKEETKEEKATSRITCLSMATSGKPEGRSGRA